MQATGVSSAVVVTSLRVDVADDVYSPHAGPHTSPSPRVPRPLLLAASAGVAVVATGSGEAQDCRAPGRRRLRAGIRVQRAAAVRSSAPCCARPLTLRASRSVAALRASVPTAWLPLFRRTQGRAARLHFSQRPQLAVLFAELKAGATRATDTGAGCADAVTLGDSWLAPAIALGLIAPVPKAEASRWLARLPPGWLTLLRRRALDGAPCCGGPIWGVPYRWGCTLLVVRTDIAACADVTDWPHLWKPQLRGRIGMVDAPREVLAIALRSLGACPNTADLGALPRGITQDMLAERLRSFMRTQVRTFDSTHSLKALASGDLWVCVANSSDVLPFAQRTPHVRVVAPSSGTQLWADLWTLPACRAADPSPLLQQWYEFTTSPARASPGAGLKHGASPLLLSPPPQQQRAKPPPLSPQPEDAALERDVMPSPAVLARSRFLAPLSALGGAQFGALLASASS